MDIIKQTGIKHPILVTSHYNDENIRKLARALGTSVLPKSLASEIIIIVNI